MKLNQVRTTDIVQPSKFTDARTLFDHIVFTGTTSKPEGIMLEDTDILGFVVFKRITAHFIPVGELHVLWTGHGLPPRYIPSNPPSKEDAFVKAIRVFERDGRENTLPSVEFRSQRFTNDRGEAVCLDGYYRVRTMVRPVTNSREEIVRHLIREIVDEKGKTLLHGRAAILTWKKKTQEAIIQIDDHVEPELRTHLNEFETEFRKLFILYCTHYDANAVRNAVRAMFRDMDVLSLSDGAVFVHRQYKDVVKRLREFFLSLAPYAARTSAPPKYHHVTVIDAEAERETVLDALIHQTLQEVTQAIEAIDKAKEEGQEPDDTLKALPGRLSQRLEAYKQLLDTNLDILEVQLKHLQAKLG